MTSGRSERKTPKFISRNNSKTLDSKRILNVNISDLDKDKQSNKIVGAK